jgi:hypothetical protein
MSQQILNGGLTLQNNEKMNENPAKSNQGAMNSPYYMQGTNQPAYYAPAAVQMMPGFAAPRTVYPEIFYKLQPYIMVVCDQMDTYGTMMPTQEMVEQMTDSIYDDVGQMYPEVADYVRSYEENAKENVPEGAGRDPMRYETIPVIAPFFGPFRRRGLFRDLIDILILSELFRRRRRH